MFKWTLHYDMLYWRVVGFPVGKNEWPTDEVEVVPKAEYDKLKAENNRLNNHLNDIRHGRLSSSANYVPLCAPSFVGIDKLSGIDQG